MNFCSAQLPQDDFVVARTDGRVRERYARIIRQTVRQVCPMVIVYGALDNSKILRRPVLLAIFTLFL
jgi:hypothetical protein